MAKIADATFNGKSGTGYSFAVYSLGTEFKALGAVYIITKRSSDSITGKFSHSAIYVGQTGDLSTRFIDHHKDQCFTKNDANCICILVENGEKARLAIETDLCRAYPNAPCNG